MHLKKKAKDPFNNMKIIWRYIFFNQKWFPLPKKAMMNITISSLTCRFKEQEAAKQSSQGQDRDYSRSRGLVTVVFRSQHHEAAVTDPQNSTRMWVRAGDRSDWTASQGRFSLNIQKVPFKACQDGHIKVTRCCNTLPSCSVCVVGG